MALPPEAAGQAAESHGLAGGGAATQAGARRRDSVVIRFAGDSGDGMQLAGMQFTTESALAGNDIATLPDFPAEIRAPAGTLAGVSGFQLNFSSSEIFTAGDEPNVLVAMNPAALKANLDDVPPNGVMIVDREAFSEANLKRAGYTSNPLTDHSLDKYQVFQVDVTKLTTLALHGTRDSTTAPSSAAATCSCSACCRGSISGRSKARSNWLEGALQEDSRRARRQPEGAQGRLQLRRDHRDVRELRTTLTRPRDRPGLLSQHHRQQRDRAGLRRGGGRVAGARCSSAPIRLRRPATFCTNSRASRISRSTPSRPRTRSRASPRRSARPSAARSRSPRPPAPG